MKTMRKAIAMLELIFAIVIMGIVLMSAPMLINTATDSGYVTIQQEGINEAASQVNMILGYNWDENDADETVRATILVTPNGDPNLDENGTTGRRFGTPIESPRRFTNDAGLRLNASTIGADVGDVNTDDMDDYDGTVAILRLIQNAQYNYVDTTVNIARTVRYTNDIGTGGTYIDPGGDNMITFAFDPASNVVTAGQATDIKRIQVTLTSTSGVEELDKSITLHAFSCNVGSFELEER